MEIGIGGESASSEHCGSALPRRPSQLRPPARVSVWVSARDSFPPLGSSPSLRPSPVPSPAPPSPIWGPRAAEKQRGGWEGGREAVTTPLEPFPLLLLLLPHACVTDKRRNRERANERERERERASWLQVGNEPTAVWAAAAPGCRPSAPTTAMGHVVFVHQLIIALFSCSSLVL